MNAIRAHFLGPTNYRGSRIVAVAGNGERLTIPYPSEANPGEDAHRVAAETLAARLDWPGHLIGGYLADGSYVFVFGPEPETVGPVILPAWLAGVTS
jgi:hypothetical protein